MWAGVDVGGRRKGFHVALVDERGVLTRLERAPTPATVARLLSESAPRLVAVDSPRVPAPDGLRSRECERALVRAGVCGIRYTPDRARLASNRGYYEWIGHGLELYGELERAGLETIECFPTASWSRWAGPRGRDRRARWTARALEALALEGVPRRLNQDERDAIAAAVTARAQDASECEAFGEIVIPRARSAA